ncbi:MAG TPA: UDP-N-acetylglucosamine 2-epimerase (non-hydrolyzing) [Saprospiraceae bacterium]|nr:UDP-N-acetylglucosamine 2-epimerase (non-hydrolyzing) [Saprospiraceae bacterium]
MKKVYFVVGARPQFIKAAPILVAMRQYPVAMKLIHTGQHYDYNLSDIFFDELEMPKPDYNLDCGSGTSTEQYLSVLSRLTQVLMHDRPDLIVVFGDTNSTGAAALSARFNGIAVAHVEAGLREFDKNIPEEINKLVADALADLYFCPSTTAVEQLEGCKADGRIIHSGDPVIDLLVTGSKYTDRPELPAEYGLTPGKYIFATCHRQSNTNHQSALENVLRIFANAHLPVLFPVHPRTMKGIHRFGLEHYLRDKNIKVIEPIGFWVTQALISQCERVLTDSGGIIKEAYFHGKYVLVLDNQTEWVEVIREGKGIVCGTDYKMAIDNLKNKPDTSSPNTALGDGTASIKIAKGIMEFLEGIHSPSV